MATIRWCPIAPKWDIYQSRYPHRKKHSFQEMGLKKEKGMLQPIILPKQYSTTDLNCQEFNLGCFWLVNQQVIRIHPKSPPRHFYIYLYNVLQTSFRVPGSKRGTAWSSIQGGITPQGVPIASYSMCSSQRHPARRERDLWSPAPWPGRTSSWFRRKSEKNWRSIWKNTDGKKKQKKTWNTNLKAPKHY